jgi:hypothetical protein
MADITILSENQIETYSTPGTKIKQQVITYLSPGLAPRTIWLDSVKLPDTAFALANPGKPIPKDVQAAGDALRRAAIEADIAKIAKAPTARKI